MTETTWAKVIYLTKHIKKFAALPESMANHKEQWRELLMSP
jgi:hypothetical protein